VITRLLAAGLVALVLAGGREECRLPFTEALVALESDAESSPPAASATVARRLVDMAKRVQAVKKDGVSRADALNRVVFGALGFAREVDDPDLRFVFLSSVLDSRRGSCVGLGTLYLALGEVLGWRVEGVMMPGHFYVRVDEGERLRNVELLRRGEEMPDAWYAQRFAVAGPGAPEYGRALSPREVLGIVEYDVGKARLRQSRWSEARRAFRVATSLFPALSEAHASLGATAQLLGSLDEAWAGYRAALRENPALPGLARNLELLREERERTR